jgi:D-3-phosphoglycerate dehydrogenase
MDILKLNEISPVADKVLGSKYKLVKESKQPVGIMLRSAAMHEYALPDSVLAVARAGAGTNNIPSAKYAEKGIVVFNTPGANANAVKELVICALLLSCRKIAEGIEWTKTLSGLGKEVSVRVEAGKGAFGGGELLGKTLGVIGLGVIGAKVANTAVDLGMNVIGYDPFISVEGAWNLNNSVRRADDVNAIYGESDFITLHIPLNDQSKSMLDAAAFNKMKKGVCIINMSRGEIVKAADLTAAIKAGKAGRYVTDFPNDEILNKENIVCIPHLGASTAEAEDNCAVMAAKQLVDYIENGNIVNSVNFPNSSMPRTGKCRAAIFHKNIKNVLSRMTEIVGGEKINIENMLSKSQGDWAYTILDLDTELPAAAEKKLQNISEVVKIRVIK